jgi:hypothetical protein
MMEAFGTVQDKKMHELTEIYDERSGQGRSATDGKNPQQIIVIDGRGYERVTSNGDKIHDLTEVVEHNYLAPQISDAVMKRTVEIIERIARDVIPDIAERVIREEIEKIKIMHKDRLSDQD